MKTSQHISCDELRRILKYEPDTGKFYWRVASHRGGPIRVGQEAGYLDAFSNRRSIAISKRRYTISRLAWLWMTGDWPDLIDHKNGNRADDRWSNLRLATHQQNSANAKPRQSTVGLKGVRKPYGKNLKYQARIRFNGKLISLGYYLNPEEAHAAYKTAAMRYFGEFARAE